MARFSRKARLPQEAFPARIDDLAHDGRGIAHLDGKAVFIEGALPGETVSFRYTAKHARHDEGRVEAVELASPERVVPRCAHFGVCGGCSLQHLAAAKQIEFKQAQLLDNLARIGKVKAERVLEPLTGPYWGYRQKARLGVKDVPKKGRVLVGFREKHSPYLAELERCEVLHPRVGGLLRALSDLVGSLGVRARLPQIEVAIGEDGDDAPVVALSFRVIDPPSADDRDKLVAFGREHGIRIYLQPGGPETTQRIWSEGVGPLSYRLPDYDLELAFEPWHFTQVNAGINRGMVAHALALLDPQPHDKVLDLFCGLGNFTLPLARRAREVVGVEGEASLVEWARGNAERNGITNARFDVADLSAAIEGQPWRIERYDKILLDPPRSGALELMPHLAALGARRIVYVSCHPATLARDAGVLVNEHGFTLRAAGVMDMFPHTAHVESIALFER